MKYFTPPKISFDPGSIIGINRRNGVELYGLSDSIVFTPVRCSTWFAFVAIFVQEIGGVLAHIIVKVEPVVLHPFQKSG